MILKILTTSLIVLILCFITRLCLPDDPDKVPTAVKVPIVVGSVGSVAVFVVAFIAGIWL